MGRLLTLDLEDMRRELRTRSFVRSSDVFGSTGDIFLTKEHGYQHVGDSVFVHIMDFEVGLPYQLAMARRGFVCIQINIKGTYERWIGEGTERVSPALIHISNQPHSVVEAAHGMKLRGLLIVCERQYLVDHFGLNVDMVPEKYRPIFTSDAGLAEPFRLPNLPATISIADQLMSCKFLEPVRSRYVQAKVVELLCTIVASIYMFPGHRHTNTTRNKSEAIACAASIYRREIYRPPTVEQLAARVGMNRNDLTSGFRDAFGLTPHNFGVMARMQEAQKLLLDGVLSISEIARRVGYEGYSSFSRAYHAYYGHAPILTKQRDQESGKFRDSSA